MRAESERRQKEADRVFVWAWLRSFNDLSLNDYTSDHALCQRLVIRSLNNAFWFSVCIHVSCQLDRIGNGKRRRLRDWYCARTIAHSETSPPPKTLVDCIPVGAIERAWLCILFPASCYPEAGVGRPERAGLAYATGKITTHPLGPILRFFAFFMPNHRLL